MAVDHLDASRQLEHQLDAIHARARAQDQRRLDLGSLRASARRPWRSTTSTPGSRARVPTTRRSANGAATIASSGRRSASAPTSPSAARAAYPTSRGFPARVTSAAGRASSAGGVGTLSSTSPTTSSAVILCTHSSGRSTRRCASAGTAMAFTSSGSTKSRPCSAARQRASLRRARLPRGLAPTAAL